MSIYASPAQGPIPFASSLAELPLPAAVERLFGARATGVVTIEAKQGRHVIYVRDGYPVSVELPGSFELLGKVLVEMKILDEPTYQATLAQPPPAGVRYGEMLRQQNLVTEEQLRQALKAQVRRKLHRLFFLSEGSIRYEATVHQEGLQHNESLRVHPWRANYHGVRSAWNADRLRQALAPIARAPLHTPLSAEELARFGLGADDGRVGALLRGGASTLDTLVADSGLAIQPVSALVFSLYLAAALDDGATSLPVAPAPAAASVPPRAPIAPSPPSGTAQGVPSMAALELEKAIEGKLATFETDDLFALLGVARDATGEQVRAAYLEAARRFHPDRLASLGLQRLRPQVEKLFGRISEAQSTLLDEARRAQYVASLDKSGADQEAHAQALSILQAELAFKRGQHLLKKNDLQAALRDFEAALTANPDEGEHVAYVAWTRYCLGRLPLGEAKSELNRGLKLQPKCAPAHYFLGMLLKEEGADDAAIASFNRAVSLDERQFDAEQEIRVLTTRKAKLNEKKGLFDRFRKK
jgi:tetratricopeptide (TPR) repeat protein